MRKRVIIKTMFLENLEYYIFGEIITCCVAVILSVSILLTFYPFEKRHKLFLSACVSCFLAALCNFISVFHISNPEKSLDSIVLLTKTLYYFFIILTPFIISLYVIEVVSINKKKKKVLNRFALFSYFIYFVLLILNIKTGFIFYFDNFDGYTLGSLQNLPYVFCIFFLIFVEVLVNVEKKSISTRLFTSLCIIPIISFTLVIIQFFLPKVILSGVATFITLLVVYLTIQVDMIGYDLITGLMTQYKLEKHIDLKKKDCVLFMVSIENLSIIQINLEIEKYNHLLAVIAKEFAKHFDKKSYFLMYSRFAALSTDLEKVQKSAEEINAFFEKINKDPAFNLPVPLEVYSVAEGIIAGEKNFDSIMNVASNLIVKAKRENNHSLCISDESVLMDVERKKIIFNILKKELTPESEQFFVCYQPIYSVSDGNFLYMEALSRLHNTAIGNISPSEFVLVAENRGLIERLGNVAFEKVCKFLSENNNVIKTVSINFSVFQVKNPNIVNTVMSMLKKYGLSPSNIIIEITENIFIEDFDVVKKNMLQLAAKGIRFFLDDFGKGCSNVSKVISLPFSTIKIDRSLVLMMEHNEQNYTLFSNIVKTFKDAGLNVLVEGVETQKQNEMVCKAGVDFIQGYLYSRPILPKQCIELLTHEKPENKEN